MVDAIVLTSPPRPRFGSGILMVWYDFEVEIPRLGRQTMSTIYFGAEQFLPPVGSRCRIRYRRAAISGEYRAGEDAQALRNLVLDLACDTASRRG